MCINGEACGRHLLCEIVRLIPLFLLCVSGEGPQPMGRHTARRGGAASAAGMHDWPQRPMGGAEAQGEGSDWSK